MPSPAVALFAGAPWRDRFHVRVRFASCPIARIDAEVPREGAVLEIGCGHGLVSATLALSSSERAVTGIDIDERKIAIAAAAARRADPAAVHLEFRPVEPAVLPDGPWDAIVIVDVLYLLDPVGERALLEAAVSRLAPGGRLIVKETDVRPRWKYAISKAQELVSTRVLRITKGSSLSFTPVEDIAAHLRGLGLTVDVERVDKGYLHPHVMVVARDPRRTSRPAQ